MRITSNSKDAVFACSLFHLTGVIIKEGSLKPASDHERRGDQEPRRLHEGRPREVQLSPGPRHARDGSV